MNNINTDKINKINNEKILESQRFTASRKMTDDVLKAARDAALIKIDKLWDDVHGNFPS